MRTCVLILCCTVGVSLALPAQPPQQIDFESLESYMDARANSDSLYVYNFWATWCKPCVAELPYFEQLHRDYASRKVKVIFVSLDFPAFAEALESFIKKKGLSAEMLWLVDPDANSWIPKVNEDWSGVIPATLLLGPSRNIRAFKEQSFTYDELTQWIQTFI
ncbi:MAG: TlpA disulfide reductase family protein [Bacteroidota bacterium]